MWDLETIIRKNEEAYAKANAPTACKCKKKKRECGVLSAPEGVFGNASYVRSVYKGDCGSHSPHEGEGEEYPEG
jgi:hypothetical protein